MHILRRGIALPIAVVILLVGAALWFVDVMSRPASGGPVGLARPGAGAPRDHPQEGPDHG